MSRIPEILRALADEWERSEHEQQEEMNHRFEYLEDCTSHIDVQVHATEDKLRQVGRLLIGDN